ncbi:hypothetical protein QE152_g1980 [Popillia japonica]|uniref:Uncharacterized protein n=1 Tax=Popillia japonica TaxID=7064 RepID=A0AAW1N2N2_POPJA
MLHKGSKSQNIRFVRKAATVLFVAEGLFFLGCYGVWHKLNTDRDFRKYMHHNYPSTLEYYYSLSIKLGAPQHIRTTDLASLVWLTGFTGLGYILYITCTPSEAQIEKLRHSLPGIEKNKSEVEKKREQYFQALQAAASEKPIYLRTKEDLKSEPKH